MSTGIEMTHLERIIKCKVQHFDPQKYWKWRERVISYQEKKGLIEKVIEPVKESL